VGLSNFGTIQGTAAGGSGVAAGGGGRIVNGSASMPTALIRGGAYGVLDKPRFGTTGALSSLINNGTIVGQTGVAFWTPGTVVNGGLIASSAGAAGVAISLKATDDLLMLPTGTLIGQVKGNGSDELELGAGATTGTIGGIGGSIAGFGSVVVDPHADWTLTGANTIAAMINAGGTVALANSATLDIAAGLTFTTPGTFSLNNGVALTLGSAFGAGRMQFIAGTLTHEMLSIGTAGAFGSMTGTTYVGPVLAGFGGTGETIDLQAFPNPGTIQGFNNTTGVLTLTSGSQTAHVQFDTISQGSGAFHLSSDQHGGTLLQRF